MDRALASVWAQLCAYSSIQATLTYINEDVAFEDYLHLSNSWTIMQIDNNNDFIQLMYSLWLYTSMSNMHQSNYQGLILSELC